MTTPPLPVEAREALERAARALYECERKRGEHGNWLLSQVKGKPADGLSVEPWEECADTFRADAKAALEAALQSPSPQSEGGAPGRIAELERKIADAQELADACEIKSPFERRIGELNAELSRLRNEQPKGGAAVQPKKLTEGERYELAVCRDILSEAVIPPAPSPGAQDVRVTDAMVEEANREYWRDRQGPKMSEGRKQFERDKMRRALNAALAQSDAQLVAQSQGGEPQAVAWRWRYELRSGTGWSQWKPADSEIDARESASEYADNYEVQALYASPRASPDGTVREALEEDIKENYECGIRPIGLIDEYFGFPLLTAPPKPGLIEAAEWHEEKATDCEKAAARSPAWNREVHNLSAKRHREFAKHFRTRAASKGSA